MEEEKMYHCHIRFYLTGCHCRAFDIIKGMSPFEHFTHEFLESEEPEEALAAQADVIFASLQGAPQMLHVLLEEKRRETELIVLAEKEQMRLLEEDWNRSGTYGRCPCQKRSADFVS